ncbi:hypothetical protein Vretimale_3370, partial [Volvox reticuliferus]
MLADQAIIASFPSCHQLLAESLTDWDVLSAASKSSWEEAILLLSRRLGCLPDAVRSLQLAEKLHLYLQLPLPLRLLLHQHCIALSALPLPRLVELLNSPPQQLAAALDGVVNSDRDPADCTGKTDWKLRWRPAVEFVSPASASPVCLSPGEALLLFLSSGWLSYDPGRRGLTRPQPSQQPLAPPGSPVDTLGDLPGAGSQATVVMEAPGRFGGTGPHPGGECRYIWHPRQGPVDRDLGLAHDCGNQHREEQHWWLQHQHWQRQLSGEPDRTGSLGAAEVATRLCTCRTLTAVVGPPPACAGEVPGCANQPRLARVEYNMYDFPASHLQLHPLIGASLDRLLFVRLTADMLPQRRRSNYAAPRPRSQPSINWKYGNNAVAAASVVTDPCADEGWAGIGSGDCSSCDIDPLTTLLTEGLVIAGRRYRRLVVKDAGKSGEKICFFAQDTLSFDDVHHGFRSLGPPSAVRQLLADVGTAAEAARRAVAAPITRVGGVGGAAAAGARGAGNGDAVTMSTCDFTAAAAKAAKAASRPDLFLSGTWPVAIHAASVCYAEDVMSSSGAVMTDGNGLICSRLARTIPYIYQGVPLPQPPLPYSSHSSVWSAANPWDAHPGSLGTSKGQAEVARQVVTADSVHGTEQPASITTMAGGPGPVRLEMAAAGPVVEPAVQLRVYDPRFGAVIKGTFTPVVSGLPPGVSLLVRASQVKAPSWKKLQMLSMMQRIGPDPPTSFPNSSVPGYSHPGSLEPAGTSTSSTYGKQSIYRRLGSSATAVHHSVPDVTQLQLFSPAAPAIIAGKRVAGYAAGNHLGTEKGSQLLLLAPRQQPAGAAAAVAQAAAAATAEIGDAVVEVVKKAPARPGAIARLNGPLILLLGACCVSARTLLDILKEELGKVLAAQRGDLTAARELAARGGGCNGDDAALLDALRLARYDADASITTVATGTTTTTTTTPLPHGLPCSTGGAAAESGGGGIWWMQSWQRNVYEAQQQEGQQRGTEEEELRDVGATEQQRLGLDYRMRELLQACATRAWRQLWELRLPLPRSASMMGLPDPSGSIPEGCVVLLPELESESGSESDQRVGRDVDASLDPGGREAGARAEREVVVYRFPGLHPRDLRKFRVVAPPPQLLSQLGLTPADTSGNQTDSRLGCGNGLGRGGGGGGGNGRLLFFSTSGSQAPVYGMSGGDYDGDQYTVIWDERVVEQFEAYQDEGAGGAKGREGQHLAASSRDGQCTGEVGSSSEDGEACWEPFQAQRVLLEAPISALVPEAEATDSRMEAVTVERDHEAEGAAAEEEEYLTRRYLFCHEAANVVTEAYRLWSWCADEYGADHPYSLMLCSLYNEALDAPKTGTFRRIPFSLRDKVRPPHWALGPAAPSPSESLVALSTTLPAGGASVQPRDGSAMQVTKVTPSTSASTAAGTNTSGPRNSAPAAAVTVTAPVTGRDRRRRQELTRVDAQRPSGDCDPWVSAGPAGAHTWTPGSADYSVDVGGSGDEGPPGEDGGFVSPRAYPALPGWWRRRVRTSTSVLARMHELLQQPEYRLPQLHPRVMAYDLPSVRLADTALATHGSLIHSQLHAHWVAASREWEQLSTATLQSRGPDATLMYQHQQHGRRGPGPATSLATAAARVLHRILVEAERIMTGGKPAAQSAGSTQADDGGGGSRGVAVSKDVASSSSSSGYCPCWMRLLQSLTPESSDWLKVRRRLEQPPFIGSGTTNSGSTSSSGGWSRLVSSSPLLCPPEACRSAG